MNSMAVSHCLSPEEPPRSIGSQVLGDIGDIFIPWETRAKRRRKQRQDEVLDCVASYAQCRIAELVIVGMDEIPDDFLGFIFPLFSP